MPLKDKIRTLNKLAHSRRYSRMQIRTQFRRVIRFPRMMLWAFLMEGIETKQMLHTYARYGRGKLLFFTKTNNPTAEELKQAKEQLKDIPRILPFFIVIVVPAPGVTEGYALLAVTLEKWLGDRFSLLPSQFRKAIRKNKLEQKEAEYPD